MLVDYGDFKIDLDFMDEDGWFDEKLSDYVQSLDNRVFDIDYTIQEDDEEEPLRIRPHSSVVASRVCQDCIKEKLAPIRFSSQFHTAIKQYCEYKQKGILESAEFRRTHNV